jgi:hypothetical protein
MLAREQVERRGGGWGANGRQVRFREGPENRGRHLTGVGSGDLLGIGGVNRGHWGHGTQEAGKRIGAGAVTGSHQVGLQRRKAHQGSQNCEDDPAKAHGFRRSGFSLTWGLRRGALRL